MQRNPPDGWPRLSVAVYYEDPRAALDWLAKAFGFETRVMVTGPKGEVVHSEMQFGEGVIMVAAHSAADRRPARVGGVNTQSVQLFVDDVDAHCARARAAGAVIAMQPENKEYGDRGYGALDCEGHLWWFSQRLDEAAWQKSIAPYRVTQAK
jgi:uncharacterized glyoxalase superfamily protein PhnB